MTKPLQRVTVHASAKVNLGWRVGPKRDDGYHDVSGLLQTIGLYDRLEIAVSDGGPPLRVSVPGHPELENEDNLVCAAAAVLAAEVEARPTTIVIHKVIPVAAGLGGGSADAAAALMGLSMVWGADLTAGDLVKLGAGIGSDVPAILVGGLVHAAGRGEAVRRVGSFTGGWVVLGISDEHISTPAAYTAFDALGPQEPDTLWHNDLERAAYELLPELVDRVDAMRRATGVAFVSGSGPTVVGVIGDEAQARAAVEQIRGTFADVQIARPVDFGVRLSLQPRR